MLEVNNAVASPTFAGSRAVKVATTFSGEMTETQGTTAQSAALPRVGDESLLHLASAEHPATEPQSRLEQPLPPMTRTDQASARPP